MAGTGPVVVYDEGVEVASGFAVTAIVPPAGTVDLVMEITEDGLTRTLEQTITQAEGVITICGTLTRSDGGNVLSGGWTYSPDEGPAENADSDPGFHDEVRAMLHVVPGEIRDASGTQSFGLGSILSLIGNIAGMFVNYTLDILLPYRPPTSCSGPMIYNGSGQSCAGVNVACDDDLDDMCLNVGNIPNVTNAFKKCMRGRCGCGGSTFRRARIGCASQSDCGPCSYAPAWGCNLAGTQIWYCHETADLCGCLNTVFHEMAHACGSIHGIGSTNPFAVGDWFEEQHSQCVPVGR